MSHFRERFKRFYRQMLERWQKQSGIPPAASSGNIASEDSCAAASNHIQPEQPRDNSPVTSPSFVTPPSSQQQLPAAQSLWDRAYDALANENPGLVKDYDELLAREEMANSAPDDTTPSLPALHSLGTRSNRSRRLDTVIQNGLKRMEDNKTTFRIAGHEFVLKEKIAKAAKFLMLGKDLIGTAVKNSPQASIVWSGVSLILILLTNPATADEANRDGFSYVTSRLAYYAALELMLHRLGQNAGVDKALISAAHDHLVDLYRAILDFQISSVLRFYHSHLKTYARDTVTSKDWKQTLLGIKTREQAVNSDFSQINDFAARQELEHLNKTSEGTHAAMKTMLSVATEHLAVSKEHLAAELAAQEDTKREKLLAKQHKCLQAFWLKRDDNGATYDWYKDRVEPRVEGTCKWFLQHENYQKWLSQESGPLLVSADPGCGKSVLAKYLIDHELAQQSAITCYFFFKDQDQNTIRQALCALLHQLLSQKSALIQHAMKLYNKMGAALVQSESSLWTILVAALHDPQTGPVIFVIDALDECDESHLGILVRNLERIFRDWQLANVKFKVLMTSRPYQQVVNEFHSLKDDFRQIHIPGEEEFEAIGQEINGVIHHRVNQLANKHRLSDKIKSSLSSKLLAIEHRTYLWIYLVFDYLDKGFNKMLRKTDDGIDAAIQTLPQSVNQAYDQILNRFPDDETVETVKKAFSIILAARRPLTLSEMNIAMNLDDQGRGRSINDLDLEQDWDFKLRLRTLCGLFVNIHHDKIYFLHQTAREFLLHSSAPTTVSSGLQWHHSITTRHANAVLAEVCMFYLDRLNSTHTATFPPDGHYGTLFQYSVDYWGDHCREAEFEMGSAMVDLAVGLCTPDLTNPLRWASIIPAEYNIRTSDLTSHSWRARVMPGRYYSRPESIMNVLFASHFGLTPVTELLLSRGADIEATNREGRTALILAANSGHEAVTRLLLENGADADVKDRQGKTALMLAADSGHEAVTRLLLENGADVDARNNDGKSGSKLLKRYDREAITQRLLDNGADVEAKVISSWYFLKLLVKSDHEAVTRLRSGNGDDAEAKDSLGKTALMLAAESGHESVTRLLLDNGADVKAKFRGGRTPLMFAADSGNEAVTRLLLDNGVDVKAKDSRGWTALMIAARLGYEAVTEPMLELGADVEAKDGKGWTALIIAAASGHEGVTRLLLENGADVKAKDSRGRTALMIAAIFGFKAVTELMLELGADVEVVDNKGRTPLMYAAESGRKATLDLISLFDSMNRESSAALLSTANSDNEAVTRLLLEHGANIEARKNDGGTALMLSAKSGDEAVTRVLLEHGANVEAKDNKGRTALRLAADSRNQAATRLLLENGANVEAKDNKGRTALKYPARLEHYLRDCDGPRVTSELEDITIGIRAGLAGENFGWAIKQKMGRVGPSMEHSSMAAHHGV